MLAAAVSAATATPSNSDHGPKLPKFWEEEPEAWFSVFKGHFRGRTPPVDQLSLFNRMLPLLPTTAVSLCRPLVGDSPPDVFQRAEKLLLAHYQLSPSERGRLLYNCTSLGDRTPTAMLQYMRTLQPGEEEGVLFRHIFVNLLPDVVREVVSSVDSLDEMATTATTVYQANAAALVSAVSAESPVQVNAVHRPSGRGGSSGRGSSGRRRGNAVCKTHSRYGCDAYKCDRPDSCPMKDMLKPPPPPSGNAPAGRN